MNKMPELTIETLKQMCLRGEAKAALWELMDVAEAQRKLLEDWRRMPSEEEIKIEMTKQWGIQSGFWATTLPFEEKMDLLVERFSEAFYQWLQEEA